MEIIRLLLKKSSKNLFLAVISSFISGASSAGLIAIINYAIANSLNLPSWLFLLFISLCLILWLFQFISQVVIARLSQEVIYDLRLEMIQRILNCPLQHLETIGSSKLLATLTGDINAIATGSIQLSTMIVNFAILIGVFVYLCRLSPLLFLIVLISIIVGLLLYEVVQEKGIKEFKRNRKVQNVLFTHFRSVTEGIKELKMHRHRRTSFINEKLKSSAVNSKNSWIVGMTTFAFANTSGTFLFFAVIGFVLFVFPELKTVSIETISSYVLSVLHIIGPTSEIASSLPQMARSNIALNEIKSLGLSISQPVVESNFITNENCNSNWRSLELIDINHTYRGHKNQKQFTLNNINIKFEKGEIVFIVGGNGSGKSTLVKLITGLYIPDKGKIVFDNCLITNENREWYRQQFSVVFYDFYLFGNLIGIEIDRKEEIQNYLNLLEIGHKVTVTNGILSTTDLSQGQCRRLALLTAYLENRPIYVFDEWASDQDPVFREVFYKKLLPELKSRGKTVIVISHDKSYFQECDSLIQLDYGRIVRKKRN